MKRLPLWGRMLGSLLIGHEADIVRGDSKRPISGGLATVPVPILPIF